MAERLRGAAGDYKRNLRVEKESVWKTRRNQLDEFIRYVGVLQLDRSDRAVLFIAGE